MTEKEFETCIQWLVKQCPVGPSEEELAVRTPELWEDLHKIPLLRLQRGMKLLIRQPDFKFFPSVGQLLDAVNSAHADSGDGWRGLSPADDDTLRLVNDPKYRREQRRIAEQAAKDYFASPEHLELLRTMAELLPKVDPSPVKRKPRKRGAK